MTPHFGQQLEKIPQGYAQNLVFRILDEKPELADDMNALMVEVNKRKMYEVRMDSATRYSRLWKQNHPQSMLL